MPVTVAGADWYKRGMTADALGMLDRLLAERECERLIIDFVHRLDLGQPSSVAELFTPDGVWEWPDGERRVEGPATLFRFPSL
jgi:hypothetical protein